jgi:hypothetical protein
MVLYLYLSVIFAPQGENNRQEVKIWFVAFHIAGRKAIYGALEIGSWRKPYHYSEGSDDNQ